MNDNAPTAQKLSDIRDFPSYSGKKVSYEKRLKALQQHLMLIQQACFHQRKKIIIVFEGVDASGKGGVIRRLTERLDPRSLRVYPTAAPTTEERAQHYLQRFQRHLPPSGHIAIFDRSWYGRVLVERVEGFATAPQWQRAFQEINAFEKMQTDDGVILLKLFMHITAEEQLKRFVERLQNPHKRWKLTSEDIRNRARWDEYCTAIDDMFGHTSTSSAPWHIVAANYKWHARLTVLNTIIKHVEEHIDVTLPQLDPAITHQSLAALGIDNDDIPSSLIDQLN
jgi:polyphosphate kinase 2 (PPK2 family)